MAVRSWSSDVRRSEVFFKPMQLRHDRNRNDPRLPGRHARAEWAVAPFCCANLLSRSAKPWFALRFSGLKRGTVLRKSVLSNFESSLILPVALIGRRRPRAQTLQISFYRACKLPDRRGISCPVYVTTRHIARKLAAPEEVERGVTLVHHRTTIRIPYQVGERLPRCRRFNLDR